MNNKISETNELFVISYKSLRKSIGILGILFPIILAIGAIAYGGCDDIQKSISAYYHTNMRDFFVGILAAIAVFMFSYRGYDKTDRIAGILAGIFALGVAFFPSSVTETTICIDTLYDGGIFHILHLISAVLLFLTLSYFSFFLFTKSNSEHEPTLQKLIRNRIYRICGIVMIISVLLIAVYLSFLKVNYPSLKEFSPAFWLETVALWAFGISWLVKGEAILKDNETSVNNSF